MRATASRSAKSFEVADALGAPQNSTKPRVASITLCIAAISFLVWGCITSLKRQSVAVSALHVMDLSQPKLEGTGFATNAVYRSTISPSVTGSLAFYGSWLGTDASTGSVHTAWYLPIPRFAVFISGYPNQKGNQLFVQAETRDGSLLRIPLSPSTDPREYWAAQSIALPDLKNVVRIRIVAVDGSIAPGGWLGFSQPFIMRGAGWRIAEELLLVILCAAAAFVIYLGPGVMLRQQLLKRFDYNLDFIWIPVPGLLGLAGVGLIAWLGPNHLSSRLIAKVSLLIVVIYCTYQLIRVPITSYTSYIERRVLLIALILVAIATSKATYSRGPVGELFGNTISRTLEVGGRSDSRLPYHVVQLIAWRQKPFSHLAKFLYKSYGVWNFSHRGALSAIAVAPLVLASPVRVPAVMPDQPWTVFDPEGFSAFRIGMIVMASCSLLIAFGLAKFFLPDEWALLAFFAVATAPFVIHEIYFTWPKLEAGSFALLAAYLILQKQRFASGLALGLGYLCHPSALMAVPSLVGVIVASSWPAVRRLNWPHRVYHWALSMLIMMAGCAVWILVWRLVNGKHFAQGQFVSYFLQANGWHPTLHQWIHHRFDSFWKTFIPLHTFFFHRRDGDANSVYGPSSASVLFCLQYWATLPFGVGIAYFLCTLRLMWVACLKARAWLLWVFVIPGLFFVIYWGTADTGLLREGLHAWVIGLLIFWVWVLKTFEMRAQRFWQVCNWALLSRIVAIPLMLLLPVISFPLQSPIRREFELSDIAALLTMLAGTVWLCLYMFRYAEILRRQAAGETLSLER